MAEVLYIFITSDRPDQYLNPILHCLQYRNISKIVFLQVENRPDSEDDPTISAKTVRQNVESLLSSLADQGKYKYLTGKDKDKEVELRSVYAPDQAASIKQQYYLLKNRKFSCTEDDVDYSKLRERLIKIRKEEPESIFDVSAIRKSYLSDILAMAVVEKIDSVYTIDLNRGPNFDEPWKSLFHELEFKKRGSNGYKYIQLTTTPIFNNCMKSILILQFPFILSLLIAAALLVTLIITSFIFGSSNWLVLIISSLATIASILSLVYTLPKFIAK